MLSLQALWFCDFHLRLPPSITPCGSDYKSGILWWGSGGSASPAAAGSISTSCSPATVWLLFLSPHLVFRGSAFSALLLVLFQYPVPRPGHVQFFSTHKWSSTSFTNAVLKRLDVAVDIESCWNGFAWCWRNTKRVCFILEKDKKKLSLVKIGGLFIHGYVVLFYLNSAKLKDKQREHKHSVLCEDYRWKAEGEGIQFDLWQLSQYVVKDYFSSVFQLQIVTWGGVRWIQ